MMRHVLALWLGLSLVLLGSTTAAAGSSVSFTAGKLWCRGDPVLKINGYVTDVALSSYNSMRTAANGPARIIVTLPVGVSGGVYATDQGFGRGYDIRFNSSAALKVTSTSIPIVVAVYAPASDPTLPLLVEVTPRGASPLTAASA